jgi:3-phosphoshikimate 1-carboxyvinyltransferase
MLRTMGAEVDIAGGRVCLRGGQRLKGCRLHVPGDLSSAAFLILAAVLSESAEVLIEGVGINPTRTGVLDILKSMGAQIALENPRSFGAEPVADIRVRSSRLAGCKVDPALVSLAIDEFPVLFVAAAAASGTTSFAGIAELRVKESDRIASMAAGLRSLGIRVEETADGAVVHGGRFTAGTVSSHGDHRVAMSFAVAATVADGAIRIDDVDAVATSFPDFRERLVELGVRILQAEGRSPAVLTPAAPVVAIDGPSGSGKGTIARRVAQALGWHFLDSGALYRLVALAARRRGIDLDDAAALAGVAAGLDVRFDITASGEERILLDGDVVTSAIRTEEAGSGASRVAALQAVRDALLGRQRAFRRPPGLVADGRDMGTQVFPDATLKVFLTASPAERAKRRHKQLKDKGIDVSLAALSRDIEERDRRDSERSVAPLVAAEDARVLDSTGLSIDAVTKTVLDWVAGD